VPSSTPFRGASFSSAPFSGAPFSGAQLHVGENSGETSFKDQAALNASVHSLLTQDLTNEQPSLTPKPLTLSIEGLKLQSIQPPGARHPLIVEASGIQRGAPFWDPNMSLSEYPNAELGQIRLHPQSKEIFFTADLHLTGHYSLHRVPRGGQRAETLSFADIAQIEWGSDGKYFCVVARQNMRPQSVRCAREEAPSNFAEVFKEEDESAIINLVTLESGQLFITSSADNWAESLSIDSKGSAFSVSVIPGLGRKEGLKHRLVSASPITLLTWSAKGGPQIQKREGGRIVTVYSSANYAEITEVKAAGNWELWFIERQGDLSQLKILSKDKNIIEPKNITAPSMRFAPETKNSGPIQILVEGPATPPRVIEIDPKSKSVLRATERLDIKKFSDLSAISIPCSVNAQPTATLTGVATRQHLENPRAIFLEVYGTYGAVTGLGFNPSLPLLRQGFWQLTAQVRGSGFWGSPWYSAGSGLRKPNSLNDLIKCAQVLKAQYPWAPLILSGRSAGALIASGAAQKNPELFSGLILDAPFLDVWEHLKTKSSPLSKRERTEWGDPRNAETQNTINSYAPFPPKIKPGFPKTLILTNLYDAVTPATQALTWAEAALRQGAEVLVIMDEQGTHSSEIDDFSFRKKQATIMAFSLLFLEP
jgi:protease II